MGLTVQQAALGGFFGYTAVAETFGPHNAARLTAGVALGVGAGVLVPLLIARDHPVSAATAMWINIGELWGLENGLALPYLWDRTPEAGVRRGAALGAGLGLGAALLLRPALPLHVGQVAALSTAQLYGSWVGLLLPYGLRAEPGPSGREVATTLVVALNLAVGATLAASPLLTGASVRQMAWADFGILVGAVAGSGAAVVIDGSEVRQRTMVWSVLGGSTLGLAAALFLAAEPEPEPEVPAWARRGDRRLELLRPTLLAPAGDGVPRLGLSLVRGRW